jgi:hypothetical protein
MHLAEWHRQWERSKSVYRNQVIVQNPVLTWNEAEIDKMRDRPENIVCNDGLDELLLLPKQNAIFQRQQC